ncbi:TLD-domain-containing protein [Tothia fuscella]|uniref:Oxidation resistance protein 1 n=1 Tax=Tothia fuscella TaxID=1048955 RepID=A0A9P4NPG0_9PEZI|nr:TLD-domain-containing protein [Tothia fuscella]
MSSPKPKRNNPAPTSPHSQQQQNRSRQNSSSYFKYPVAYTVSGILRRLSYDTNTTSKPSNSPHTEHSKGDNMNTLFQPPRRIASPFQPPPLTPLKLTGWRNTTKENSRLLTKALAEEIRLLIPARLQLVDDWHLIYSLEQNGVSLSTLYKQCEEYRGKRGGYVLVVRDGLGGIFGSYLSDALRPAPHYYGTGECFLWRSSILPSIPDLASLPPPPSADTTHAQRQTTLQNPKVSSLTPTSSAGVSRSGTSTPERIRFKAFPYSGVNDYMIFCEGGYLSIGGGDGHYGLWLDDSLERGISSSCLTFGNEPLSDEGKKFDVMGVELWYLGT